MKDDYAGPIWLKQGAVILFCLMWFVGQFTMLVLPGIAAMVTKHFVQQYSRGPIPDHKELFGRDAVLWGLNIAAMGLVVGVLPALIALWVNRYVNSDDDP